MLQVNNNNKKKQNHFIDIFDDVLDEDNPFNDTMKTEYVFIDDNLLDDTEQKEIKQVPEDVLQDLNIDQNKALFVDLPEEWPEKVKIAPEKEEAAFVDLPEECSEKVEIAPKIAPKAKETPRIITPNACLKFAAVRIKKNIKDKDKKRTLEKSK